MKLANVAPGWAAVGRKLVGLANDVEPVLRAETRAAKAWFGPSGTFSRFCVVRVA